MQNLRYLLIIASICPLVDQIKLIVYSMTIHHFQSFLVLMTLLLKWFKKSLQAASLWLLYLSLFCLMYASFTPFWKHSTEGHQNSFSTSTSHHTAVTLFYEIIIFICVMPKSHYSMDQNKMVSMFYTMLKLQIYSLRNKGDKEVMRKCLSLTGSHRYLEF